MRAADVRLTVVPLLAAIVFVELPLTVIVSYAENQYHDGLMLPFVTQAAREGASFWILAIGQLLLWANLCAIGIVSERWMRGVGRVLKLSRKPFGHNCLACCCAHYDRFNQAMKLCFCLSGFLFAVSAWSNHIFFHHNRIVDLHSYITVGAFALAVTAMTINTYVINELAKLLDKEGSSSSRSCCPPELRAVLMRSKQLKRIATYVINICMAAHVPTTYVYEWFCDGNIGPHAPRGTTFYSVAACESELGRGVDYCSRWTDERNATMTLLFAPPADSCPSIGLSLYNAITEYVAIAAITLFVYTLQSDLRGYKPEDVEEPGARSASPRDINEQPDAGVTSAAVSIERL